MGGQKAIKMYVPH